MPAWVAQLVERFPEEEDVASSILAPSTKMLLVKTRIGPSNIAGAGTGLFADQFIQKGTITWRFNPGFDLRLDEDYPASLPEIAREFFYRYAAQDPKTKKYTLCLDNARFYNHSDTPNTCAMGSEVSSDEQDVALRDIEPGEELTIDYRTFDTGSINF